MNPKPTINAAAFNSSKKKLLFLNGFETLYPIIFSPKYD